MMNFVLKERLQWTDLKPSSTTPFSEPGGSTLAKAYNQRHLAYLLPGDIKILYNDWPYGVDEKIVHLVIWTKFDIEDDPATDDLTPRARKEVNNYVDKVFGNKMPPEHVCFSC